MMNDTVAVSEARALLPKIIDRVEAGDEVILTRHGRPVAVIRRPDADRRQRLDAVRAQARSLDDLIDAAGRRPLTEQGTISADIAAELVNDVRAGRSQR